jgi:hypothetical protein
MTPAYTARTAMRLHASQLKNKILNHLMLGHTARVSLHPSPGRQCALGAEHCQCAAPNAQLHKVFTKTTITRWLLCCDNVGYTNADCSKRCMKLLRVIWDLLRCKRGCGCCVRVRLGNCWCTSAHNSCCHLPTQRLHADECSEHMQHDVFMRCPNFQVKQVQNRSAPLSQGSSALITCNALRRSGASSQVMRADELVLLTVGKVQGQELAEHKH